VIIICPTIDYNNDYEKFAKNNSVTLISSPTEENINKIFDDCCAAQLKVKEHEREKKRKMICPKILVWFDDIIDSGLFGFRGVVDKYAERGRHVNISFGGSSQRISAVSRSIRLNSDYFIIFAPYSISELEQFIEQFVSKDKKKEAWKRASEIFEDEYQFIILDNTEKQPKKKLKVSNAEDFIKGIKKPFFI
jgi:hypothetical protein